MKRKRVWIPSLVVFVLLAMFCGGLWSATSAMLFPVWRGVSKDLSVCSTETARFWGEGCGNLRTTHELRFDEVRIRSTNGNELPGWLIGTSANEMGAARGAIFLVHGGGGDRREETKYVRFFLEHHLDVLTFDLGCHGEAPCSVPGMTYGQRESRDVLSAYLFLLANHERVYAMGTSVGAASILIALPEMPKLAGVIAENPMVNFERLVMETPAAKGVPRWFKRLLVKATMLRGRFDGLQSPENSLRMPLLTTPIAFLHSKRDSVVPHEQTEELASLYAGPKTLWLPDEGDHCAIWDVDRIEYEKRLAAFLDAHP